MSNDTFTQPKIRGYRQLNAYEAALMSKAKELEADYSTLLGQIKAHFASQRRSVEEMPEMEAAVERARLNNSESERWLAMGRTDLQTAVMKICRAIAQPRSDS